VDNSNKLNQEIKGKLWQGPYFATSVGKFKKGASFLLAYCRRKWHDAQYSSAHFV